MIIATYVPKMTDGGVERVVSNLLPLWINMGHQVVLYTDVPASALDYSYPQEIKRIVLGELSLSERESFWKESLSNEKVDVMVYHHWLSGFMHTDCECIQALDIPFILYTHGHFTARFTHYDDYIKAWPSLVAKCDLVLSLTELNNRFYEMHGAKARVVRNPISDELVKLSEECAKQSRSYSLDAPKIVWIGRFTKGKRPMDALKIFKAVQKQIPDAQFYFIGTGNPKIEAKLKSKAGKNVFFEGYSSDVFSYLKTADLMLMTSEKEGYPTIITESYAAGVPIAMYNLPYLKPCQDEKGMITAKIGAKRDLSDKIIRYLMTDNLHSLKKEARHYFRELCSYDVMAMWEKIFDNICNNQQQFTEIYSDLDSEIIHQYARQIWIARLVTIKHRILSILG